MLRSLFIGIMLLLALLLAACDPLLSIQGSFWPPWIVCMLAGLLLTVLASLLFFWFKLDPHLGHPMLIYPSLWALMTFAVWLIAFAE
jgi:hypothetical protein